VINKNVCREEEEMQMRKHKGQDVLAGALAFLLAVSMAGCCKSKNDDSHSLSLLGGVLGTGIIEPPVGLASAGTFRVLANSTVANTGPTSVDGDLGVSPGSAVTGFPPGTVSGGTFTGSPGPAATAQSDLTIAYNNAAARPPGTAVAGNIGGQTLAPGVFTSTSSLAISSGDLTLTGLGNPNAVFIFQIASSLTVTSGRRVILAGGAKASNVFWQVGSSATLGTNSFFVGDIMALASITLQTGASLEGRALASTGAVTLDSNVIFP
jgi:ice-binding like protein